MKRQTRNHIITTLIRIIIVLLIVFGILVVYNTTTEATSYNFDINLSDYTTTNFTANISVLLNDRNMTNLTVTQQGNTIFNYYNITFDNNYTEPFNYSLNISHNFTTSNNYSNIATFQFYSLNNNSLLHEEILNLSFNVFTYNNSINITINETENTTNNTNLFNKTTVVLTIEGGNLKFILPDASLPFNFTDTRTIKANNGSIINVNCSGFIICPTTISMPFNNTITTINLTVFVPKFTLVNNYTSAITFTLDNTSGTIEYFINVFNAPIQTNVTFDNLTAEQRIQLLKDLSDYINRGILEAENRTKTIYENQTIINTTYVPVTTYDFSFQELISSALNQNDQIEVLAQNLQQQLEINSKNKEEYDRNVGLLKSDIGNLNQSFQSQLVEQESSKNKLEYVYKLRYWITLGIILFFVIAVTYANRNYKEQNMYGRSLFDDVFGR